MHPRSWGRFFLWVIGGALYLVAGVPCIVNPLLASVVLTLLLGAGLIAAGLVRVYLATQLPPGQLRHMVFRARGHDFARFDHRQSLAAGQRVCIANIARRRPPVSWRRLGELWYGDCIRGADPFSLHVHLRSEQ